MIYTVFAAAEASEASGLSALGVNLTAFIVQLITFVFFFILLKKFAFNPIVALLDKRHKTIEDGVKLGHKMEREQHRLEEKVAAEMRQARHEADRIIASAHKEAREIQREAEKSAQRKTNAMITDAQVRIEEEARQASKDMEKDIVGLISEATEAIVGEKVDEKKDQQLIDKALKGRKKK